MCSSQRSAYHYIRLRLEWVGIYFHDIYTIFLKFFYEIIYKSFVLCYNTHMDELTSEKFYLRALPTLLNVQKIVTVHYQQLGKGFISDEETHDFWELIYADKQEICVLIDGDAYFVKQGEAIFLPPNAPHHVESGSREPNLFIFSFVCRSKSMEFFSRKILAVNEHYRYLLENIMTEADKIFVIPDFAPAMRKLERRDAVSPGGEQIIKNTIELLLVYLLREETATPQKFLLSKADSSEELHDEIIQLLSEGLYEDFSLNILCEKLHYGKTHLCTVFREKTGASIYATYLKMRISEAKKLIRKGLSFSEIAEKLRFDSLPHFTRIFKKQTGMTPREYRESIRQEI